jgi:hypothetical protein
MRRTSITPTPPFFVLTLGSARFVVVDDDDESFSIPFPALFLRSVGEDILTGLGFVIRLELFQIEA